MWKMTSALLFPLHTCDSRPTPRSHSEETGESREQVGQREGKLRSFSWDQKPSHRSLTCGGFIMGLARTHAFSCREPLTSALRGISVFPLEDGMFSIKLVVELK
ncbi:unnamed protein product [Rangifer tarandus platyrhynchus]|uniref:Secreted protein n=1 Tax=Rangifer tarandus platyrhynchus TaxID=3082113 RepID=A0ABN8YZI7_RANTA|nr:unnamed protein product [Rangifer tarandus platyrhynchus]